MSEDDKPQHEHLKEEDVSASHVMYSGLPPMITLKDIADVLGSEFPMRNSIEEVKQNLTDVGKSVPIRLIKVTIEYYGETVEPNDGN